MAPRPLPEELLLLCADPRTGRIRQPLNFHRVIAGAVLAELLVRGAITVEKRHITGFQPLGASDPAGAAVLARLSDSGKRRRGAGLDATVRRTSFKAADGYLDSLVTQGLVTVESRRLLGFLPYRRFASTSPETVREIGARVRAAALTPPGGAADARDRQLAGLIAAGRLERRVLPGPEGAPARRAVRVLMRELPIAAAVRRVLNSDSAGGSSG